MRESPRCGMAQVWFRLECAFWTARLDASEPLAKCVR
jgi:hypothetical protein